MQPNVLVVFAGSDIKRRSVFIQLSAGPRQQIANWVFIVAIGWCSCGMDKLAKYLLDHRQLTKYIRYFDLLSYVPSAWQHLIMWSSLIRLAIWFSFNSSCTEKKQTFHAMLESHTGQRGWNVSGHGLLLCGHSINIKKGLLNCGNSLQTQKPNVSRVFNFAYVGAETGCKMLTLLLFFLDKVPWDTVSDVWVLTVIRSRAWISACC